MAWSAFVTTAAVQRHRWATHCHGWQGGRRRTLVSPGAWWERACPHVAREDVRETTFTTHKRRKGHNDRGQQHSAVHGFWLAPQDLKSVSAVIANYQPATPWPCHDARAMSDRPIKRLSYRELLLTPHNDGVYLLTLTLLSHIITLLTLWGSKESHSQPV